MLQDPQHMLLGMLRASVFFFQIPQVGALARILSIKP
jgi:hypothetical protein